MNKPPFNHPLVRKAFSLALDKDFICTETLRGDGQPIKKGFIPKTWYYSNEKLPVIEQDIAQAKRCFLEAGYSSQNPFPKLLLYVNAQKGSNADLWCTEVCRQLKNVLGVEVKVKYVSTSEQDEKIKSGIVGKIHLRVLNTVSIDGSPKSNAVRKSTSFCCHLGRTPIKLVVPTIKSE